jgi:hypothetical protein
MIHWWVEVGGGVGRGVGGGRAADRVSTIWGQIQYCITIKPLVWQMCRPSATVELYKKIAQGYFLYESIHRDIDYKLRTKQKGIVQI